MTKSTKTRAELLNEIQTTQNLLTELEGKRTILKSHQREQSNVNVRDRGEQIKLLKQKLHDIVVDLIVEPKSKKLIAEKKSLSDELTGLLELGDHHFGKAKAMADKLKQYRSERSSLQATRRVLVAQLSKDEHTEALAKFDPTASSVSDLQTLIARQIYSAVINGAGIGGIHWEVVHGEIFKLAFGGENLKEASHNCMQKALEFDKQLDIELSLSGIPQKKKVA